MLPPLISDQPPITRLVPSNCVPRPSSFCAFHPWRCSWLGTQRFTYLKPASEKPTARVAIRLAGKYVANGNEQPMFAGDTCVVFRQTYRLVCVCVWRCERPNQTLPAAYVIIIMYN